MTLDRRLNLAHKSLKYLPQFLLETDVISKEIDFVASEIRKFVMA